MVLADVLLVLIIGAGAAGLIHYFLRAGRQETPDERMLREYTRLTLAAAEASRKGHEGESLVYGEAARRLLETWNERKP